MLPSTLLNGREPMAVLTVGTGRTAFKGVNSSSVSDGSHESVYLCPFYVLTSEGRRITTHSGMTDRLKAIHQGMVVEGERFVTDGNIVTAAGVSAGIDMSLWVVGQIYGEDHARTVQANLEYKPVPPY